MKYFKNITSIQNLRAEFLKLSKIHHPDKGGKTETFQAMLNEFESLLKSKDFFKTMNEGNEAFKESNFEKETAFSEIILKVFGLPVEGLEVEICGLWLWLHNVGRENKDIHKQLKNLGFRFAPNKKAWYYKDYKAKRSYSRGSYSMDEIRDKYNSTKYKKVSSKRLAA
jgi:curved DNA-binding protein CbpA